MTMASKPNSVLSRDGRIRAPGVVSSLDKGIDLLEVLATAPYSYGLLELARLIDEDKSNVHRMLATLMARHCVTRDPVTKKYSPGPQLMRLAAPLLAQSDIAAAGRTIMDRLAVATKQTVFLARLVGTSVTVIDRRNSTDVVGVNTGIGFEAPPHCSAVGKILLAHLDRDRVSEILDQTMLTRFTEQTITDRTELLMHLAVVRERGYSMDDEEHRMGLRCIAVPVRDRHGAVVAAIGISGPVFAVTRQAVPDLTRVLIALASEFSATLGFVGSAVHAPDNGTPESYV